MRYILLIALIFLACNGWCGDKLDRVCAICLTRFYEVQGYYLCEKDFEKYDKEEEINLHASTYCGPYCAHGNSKSEIDKCPYKNKLKKLIKPKP